MISEPVSVADIGNRITELSKAIVWMHGDMKVVQQLLVEDDHSTHDTLPRDGSSVLGKYIIGAKNNFRGFSSRQEDKRASPQVTVHHGEEGEEKAKGDSAEDLKLQVGPGEESKEEEEELSHCVAVKMEGSQVKAKLPTARQVDGGEPEQEDGFTLREKAVAAGFDHPKDEGKAEVDVDEAEQRRSADVFPGVRGGDKHTEGDSDEVGSGGENSDIRTVLSKFKDIEPHEQRERAEAKWRKGRKLEHYVMEKTDIREEKVETKKNIPSPTGSNGSQDTGFGSQEGEGSIDGILVIP